LSKTVITGLPASGSVTLRSTPQKPWRPQAQFSGSVTLRTVSAVIDATARKTKKANGLHLIRFQELGVDQMIHSL